MLHFECAAQETQFLATVEWGYLKLRLHTHSLLNTQVVPATQVKGPDQPFPPPEAVLLLNSTHLLILELTLTP